MNTIKWGWGGEWQSTGLRGYFFSDFSFEETVARLVALTGKQPEGGDKTSFEFEGVFREQKFTIYDYRSDNKFHIGGGDHLNIDALVDELQLELRTVQPVAYVAHYDPEYGGGSHSWTAR